MKVKKYLEFKIDMVDKFNQVMVKVQKCKENSVCTNNDKQKVFQNY